MSKKTTRAKKEMGTMKACYYFRSDPCDYEWAHWNYHHGCYCC